MKINIPEIVLYFFKGKCFYTVGKTTWKIKSQKKTEGTRVHREKKGKNEETEKKTELIHSRKI